jgi:hypothetical protein
MSQLLFGREDRVIKTFLFDKSGEFFRVCAAKDRMKYAYVIRFHTIDNLAFSQLNSSEIHVTIMSRHILISGELSLL